MLPVLFYPLACLVIERRPSEVIKHVVNFMVVRSSYKWEAEALFVLKGRTMPESNRGNSACCSTEWTGACSVGRLSLIFMCSLKTVVWVGGAQGFLDWGGGLSVQLIGQNQIYEDCCHFCDQGFCPKLGLHCGVLVSGSVFRHISSAFL